MIDPRDHPSHDPYKNSHEYIIHDASVIGELLDKVAVEIIEASII